MPLVSTIDAIPIYDGAADLIDDGQEHGNLAITVTPSTLWIWFETWTPVTSTTTTDLALRVARLERLLADVGEILARE